VLGFLLEEYLEGPTNEAKIHQFFPKTTFSVKEKIFRLNLAKTASRKTINVLSLRVTPYCIALYQQGFDNVSLSRHHLTETTPA
jgi:hypothetical protein